MKILAISQQIENSKREMSVSLFEEEIKVVWEMYQGGFIREFYAKANTHRVVFILECNDVDEAQTKRTSLLKMGHH